MIQLKLHHLGQIYESEGKDIEEALMALPIKLVRGKGVISINNGVRTAEKVISPFIMSKMFTVNPKNKELFIKKYGVMFNI